MRRTVLIAPDLHDKNGEPSVIRSDIPILARFRGHGCLSKIMNPESKWIIEAEYLGLDSETISMQQGPLTIAALGYDPPDRSAHYHLSMLSIEGEVVEIPKVQVHPELIDQILELSKKLNTTRITICGGAESNHGLVIEQGSPESETASPELAHGKLMRESLPKGDDELKLRRFIDDSINLLSEQDFNLQRLDNGLQPINLLWPWGGGWRQQVPNLGLRYGEIGYVASNSIRFQGLTKLAGWKHCSRNEPERGTRINFEFLLNWVRSHELSICFLSEFAEFRRAEKYEELSWLASEMNRRLFMPLYADMIEGEVKVTVISPSSHVDTSGIAMTSGLRLLDEASAPFDERLLEEKRIPTFTTAETVRRGMVEDE
jgi:2,3-bisphosphoglycerate-independent phosphoglycerate mutase